eukprot:gene67187-92044_t
MPVLPSADVARDVAWYKEKAGENICIHLQWHADTADDPLLGGSVIRIDVKNIQPLFEEFLQRGI